MIAILLVVFLSISRGEVDVDQSYTVTASYAEGAPLDLPYGWTIEDEQTAGDTTSWRVHVGIIARRGIVQLRVGDGETSVRVNGPSQVWMPIAGR